MSDGLLKDFKDFLACLEPFESSQSLRRRGKFTKELNKHIRFGAPLPPDFRRVIATKMARLDLMAWAVELAYGECDEVVRRVELLSLIICRDEVFLEPLVAYLRGDTGQAQSIFQHLLRAPKSRTEHIFTANWLRYLRNKMDLPAKPQCSLAKREVMQFWHKNPPSDVKERMTQWSKLAHPGHYTLYNEKTASNYIRNKMGPTEARLFKAIPNPASQSDLIRFVHLYFEGGFYIDADFEPSVAAGALLNLPNSEFLMTQSARILCAIAPGLMGVKPNNPVIKLCVETVFRIWADNVHLSPMIYGPYLIRWAMHQVDPEAERIFVTCSKKDLGKYFARNFKPNYKSDAHWRHLWNQDEKRVKTMDWARE